MSGTTSPLAALLVLLMVSASASSCDLSCCLRRTHSDCRSAGSVLTNKADTAVSMSPDMNMAPDQTSTGPDAGVNAAPPNSRSVLPDTDTAFEHFEYATKPESGGGSTPEHSKSISSCSQEACSQVWVSDSVPGLDHARHDFLGWTAIGIPGLLNMKVGAPWARLRASPPEIPRLATTLRI
jgi:hypothetical protein